MWHCAVMSWQAAWQTDVFEQEGYQYEEEDVGQPLSKPPKKKKTWNRDKENSEKAAEEPAKTRRRALLNKAEKKKITMHLLVLKCEEITLKCLANSARQLALVSDNLKSFCELLTVVGLLFLTKHLQETFVRIYDCSMLKERYLQFQLKLLFIIIIIILLYSVQH